VCLQSIEREQGTLQFDRDTIGPLVRVLQVDNVKLGSEVRAHRPLAARGPLITPLRRCISCFKIANSTSLTQTLLLLLLQGLDRIAALTQLQQLTLFNLQLQDLVSAAVVIVLT
jgi:hypothetical protein